VIGSKKLGQCCAWMAGVAFIGGCSSTVTIPASQLRLLSAPRVANMADWPEVTAVDGEKVEIVGDVEFLKARVEMHMHGSKTSEELTLESPFVAWNRDPYVLVQHQLPFRGGFGITPDTPVLVQYKDRKQLRTALGSSMVGLGALGLFFGFAGLTAQKTGTESHFETTLAMTFITGTGIGLVVSGAILAARAPEKPHQSAHLHSPRFFVGRNGAGISGAF